MPMYAELAHWPFAPANLRRDVVGRSGYLRLAEAQLSFTALHFRIVVTETRPGIVRTIRV